MKKYVNNKTCGGEGQVDGWAGMRKTWFKMLIKSHQKHKKKLFFI
jgi:hypothetical protein